MGSEMGVVKRFVQVQAATDIFIFGYPESLGISGHEPLEHSQPLLRQGIVAGKNSRLKTLIIDCPSYGGNSGGPVLEVTQTDPFTHVFRVIGLVTEFIPYEERWKSEATGVVNRSWESSGYSVVEPIDRALELVWE